MHSSSVAGSDQGDGIGGNEQGPEATNLATIAGDEDFISDWSPSPSPSPMVNFILCYKAE